MENINPIPEMVGETTDVECWLIRAGLKFSDLGDDAASIAIRQQWRQYQAAVQRCCAILRLPASEVQLSGNYAKLRIPCGLEGGMGNGAWGNGKQGEQGEQGRQGDKETRGWGENLQ